MCIKNRVLARNYTSLGWRSKTKEEDESEDAATEIKKRWQTLYKEFNDEGNGMRGTTEKSMCFWMDLQIAIGRLNEELGIPKGRIIEFVKQYISASEQESERFFNSLADFLKT